MGFFQLGYVISFVYSQCNADIYLLDWEPNNSKSDGSGGRVSDWRSILVANEWSELQTIRKTDIRFTLFFIGFLIVNITLKCKILF